jgi:hypothetical protein
VGTGDGSPPSAPPARPISSLPCPGLPPRDKAWTPRSCCWDVSEITRIVPSSVPAALLSPRGMSVDRNLRETAGNCPRCWLPPARPHQQPRQHNGNGGSGQVNQRVAKYPSSGVWRPTMLRSGRRSSRRVPPATWARHPRFMIRGVAARQRMGGYRRSHNSHNSHNSHCEYYRSPARRPSRIRHAGKAS